MSFANYGTINNAPGGQVGNHNTQYNDVPKTRPHTLGVITARTREYRAVRDLLLAPTLTRDHCVGILHNTIEVALAQTTEPGQHAAMAAAHRLRTRFRPATIVLLGTAAALDESRLRAGDVVLANPVIYFDRRTATKGAPLRQAKVSQIPRATVGAVHRFLADNDDMLPVQGRACWIRFGPVGSGDARIAHDDAEVLTWLRRVHHEVLAVETEAGAIAHAAYEENSANWLTLHGIAGHADPQGTTLHEPMAARHAAAALERLSPYLCGLR